MYASLEGFDAKKYHAAYVSMEEEQAVVSFVFETINVIVGFGPVLRTFNNVPVKSINMIKVESALKADEPLAYTNSFLPFSFEEKHKPVFKAGHDLVLSWFAEAKEQLLYRYKTSDLLHELLNEVAQLAARAQNMIAELRCCDAMYGMKFVGKVDNVYEFSFTLIGIRRCIQIILSINPASYPYSVIRPKLTFDAYDRKLYKPEAYPLCLQKTVPGSDYMLRLLECSKMFVKAQRVHNTKKRRQAKLAKKGQGELLQRSFN
jgi:hypothetical protein